MLTNKYTILAFFMYDGNFLQSVFPFTFFTIGYFCTHLVK